MNLIDAFIGYFCDNEFIINLLNTSISACWLVGAVLLFRLIFRRAPRWLMVALWAVVAVRLLCPVPIESRLSLVPTAEPIPAELLAIDPNKGPENVTVDIIENPVYPDAADSSVSLNTDIGMTAAIVNLVWLYGVGAMALYAFFSCLTVCLKVRQSAYLKDNIYLCDGIDTPFIFGVIRPKIYLPSLMYEGDREFVLAHERAHLRRKDYLWKPLGFLILAVYWFNPVMWLSYILLCRDIEMACDERVIREMGAEVKKPYSLALINCSVPKRMITACPVAFGETGVKKRIKAVLSYKRPALWLIILALVTGIVLAVCFATSPETEGTVPERNYLIQTDEGEDMFRFDETVEYSEYFTVYKGERSYFRATAGNGRSNVLNLLSSLSLERLPEMSSEGLSQSGKIAVENSDGSIEVIFCDGFSKVFMRNTGGGKKSALYAVDAEQVQKFFREEKYMKQGNIWECDFISSAYGHGFIVFYNDELLSLTQEPTAKSGSISPYTSDEHGKGYMWTPEITDSGVGEEDTVTFKGIMYGKQSEITVSITKVGQNDGHSVYYLVSAEDTVIANWGTGYEYSLSKPQIINENNEWYCNPVLSSLAYFNINFSLPTEYRLISAECSEGEARIDNIYYLESNGEKQVQWSPDSGTYLTAESYEIRIKASKKGEEVSFTVKVVGTERTDEMGGRIFKLEFSDCIGVNKGWAYYELHESENTVAADLDKAVSQAILDYNKQYDSLGECPAEGHVILGTKEKGDTVTVYMLERYASYGFEDGWFIVQSGHSTAGVMSFGKKDGGYTFLDVEYVDDGSAMKNSVKRLFPKNCESRALSPTEKDRAQMDTQCRAYAEAYLDSVGRTEPIGTYADLDAVLLTDMGISVEVSNKLSGLAVNYDTGKIGYFESVENDVRYIYRTSYFPEDKLITYTKEVYGTGEIKKKIEINSVTGNVISAFNSPDYSDSFEAEIIGIDMPGNSLSVKPSDDEIKREYGENIFIRQVSDFENLYVTAKVRVYYNGQSLQVNDYSGATSTAIISEVFDIALSDDGGGAAAEQTSFAFDAKVLDVYKDGKSVLVEPLEGTDERKSSDKIRVSVDDMGLVGKASELKKGTKLRIIYDGQIMETYPAELGKVYAVYSYGDELGKERGEPTTRAYYIIGETDTGEPSLLPADFDIRFSFGGDNLGSYYDTYINVIGKETGTYKTEEKPFKPSADELKKIYDKAVELDIFSIEGRMTAEAINPANAEGVEPNVKYSISITCDGKDYHINGDITATFCCDTSDEADRFCEFVSFMNGIYSENMK